MSGSPFGIGEYLSSNKAANNMLIATNKAVKEMRRQYNQTRADAMPFITAGRKAINQLSSLTSEGGRLYNVDQYGVDAYNESDYNKWLTQQGVNSIIAKAAAGGRLGSGNLGTALVEYSQNMAGAGYNDWYNRQVNEDTMLYNRLMGIVNPSQTAISTVGSAGTNEANNYANTILGGTNTANNYSLAGIAAMGNSSGQIGNQILSAIGTYQRQNAYQNYLNNSTWNGYNNLGYGQYQSYQGAESSGWQFGNA